MGELLENQIKEALAIGEWAVFLRDLVAALGVADDDPRLMKIIRDFRERPYYVVREDIFGQEIVVGTTPTAEEAIKLAKELMSQCSATDLYIFRYVVCGPDIEEGVKL